MRGQLDENLPARLVPPLRQLGHDADEAISGGQRPAAAAPVGPAPGATLMVFGEGLAGLRDDDLWPVVQAGSCSPITEDPDFAYARHYRTGTHAGIMVLRLSDDRSHAAARRIRLLFEESPVDTWTGCLVVVTDHEIRVRRPQPDTA
ncbi:MAG: DUF5615 family PIN-like protein [Candidatus Latescibacterota bacterium]